MEIEYGYREFLVIMNVSAIISVDVGTMSKHVNLYAITFLFHFSFLFYNYLLHESQYI